MRTNIFSLRDRYFAADRRQVLQFHIATRSIITSRTKISILTIADVTSWKYYLKIIELQLRLKVGKQSINKQQLSGSIYRVEASSILLVNGTLLIQYFLELHRRWRDRRVPSHTTTQCKRYCNQSKRGKFSFDTNSLTFSFPHSRTIRKYDIF